MIETVPQTTAVEKVTQVKADFVRRAYGEALFELAYGLKFHETCGGEYPTVEEVQDSPELYDGCVGGACYTSNVIGTFLKMLQAERREDPERCNNNDPIDRLVACGAPAGTKAMSRTGSSRAAERLCARNAATSREKPRDRHRRSPSCRCTSRRSRPPRRPRSPAGSSNPNGAPGAKRNARPIRQPPKAGVRRR